MRNVQKVPHGHHVIGRCRLTLKVLKYVIILELEPLFSDI